MNNIDLSKPTRQSVKGLVFIFLYSLQKSIRAFWPILILLVLKNKIFEDTLYVVIGLIAIVVLLLVHAILFYLNFYFYVVNDEFILKKGYLRKQVLTIPLERIQSVNTKQNLIQQALDVLSLEIDTAGAVGKELKIHALEKEYAKELQKLLSEGKTESVDEAEEVVEEVKEKKILQLSPVDLFKIGISENHLRTGLIIVAFGFQIFQQVDDLFQEKAEEYSNEFVSFMSNSTWGLITFLAIIFLFISIISSLVRTVYKYFDFKLLKKGDMYRVESGLVNKRNVVMPIHKIQELNWETGPLKQIFGIYNLVFKQAVSGRNKKTQVVNAPGCLTNHLEELKTDLFGEDVLSDLEKRYTNKYYFRRLWAVSGLTPVVLASVFLYSEWIFWVSALCWLLITAGYSYLILKKRYFQLDQNQIRISKGAIEHRWKQMELYKIQSVEFRQTIFQKRRSLASLKLSNASGSMVVPYINAQLARQIYNYLLYHTETSNKKWM